MTKLTSTMQEDYGPLGIIIPFFARIEEEPQSFRKGVKHGRDGSRQQKSNYYFSKRKS